MQNDRFKLGLYQAQRYFGFLIKQALDDVIQEIRIAEWQCKELSQREMNNAVNRRLHGLARSLGWRKTNPATCPSDKGLVSSYVLMHEQFKEWEIGKRI